MRPAFLTCLISLCTLGACSSPSTPASDPYGLWMGKLVTEQGLCPTDEMSSLRIRGHEIVFNPGMNSSTLRGTYEKGQQHYLAELVDKGMNGTPYRQTFNGYPVGTAIGGTYTSPRCRAHISLVRR